SDALVVATRLAAALDHAHARGVLHRDVKPENVVLEGGHVARARLVDFGLARFEGDRGEFQTSAGAMLGTPGYMSPEQVRGECLDERADVFALGGVLYPCLTGKSPFAGHDAVATLARVLFAEPKPLRDARPDAPRALDALLARALAKDPGR